MELAGQRFASLYLADVLEVLAPQISAVQIHATSRIIAIPRRIAGQVTSAGQNESKQKRGTEVPSCAGIDENC